MKNFALGIICVLLLEKLFTEKIAIEPRLEIPKAQHAIQRHRGVNFERDFQEPERRDVVWVQIFP
jgi:hypothetical protein